MSDEIRAGDRIELPFTVRAVTDVGGAFVTVDGDHSCERFFLYSTQVALGRRLPTPIKVGDRVTVKKASFIGKPKGTVEWTDGTDALVRWSDVVAGLEVKDLSDLTPIPGDQP